MMWCCGVLAYSSACFSSGVYHIPLSMSISFLRCPLYAGISIGLPVWSRFSWCAFLRSNFCAVLLVYLCWFLYSNRMVLSFSSNLEYFMFTFPAV